MKNILQAKILDRVTCFMGHTNIEKIETFYVFGT